MTPKQTLSTSMQVGLMTSLACSMAWAGPIPNPTHTAKTVPGSRTMYRGDFEDSSISSHAYRTSWQGWRFGPNTGMVKEGKAFAAGQNFENGSYGLFLQKGDSWAERNVGLAPGAWVFSFKASQRLRSGNYEKQSIRVYIDGREVFDQRISGGGFQTYFSRPFTQSDDRIDVRLEGLNTSGDNSAILDNFRFERVGLWNDSATWQGGNVPGSVTHNVRIPSGVRVALPESNTSIRAGHIHLQGELGVISQGGSRTKISCYSILVDGSNAKFVVGTDYAPHPGLFDINLLGSNRSFDIEGFGNKFIGVRNGGLLSLHGRDVTNYVELGETARPGDKSIVTRTRPSGWRVGHDIVISATRGRTGSVWGWDQNEKRKITKIENISGGRSRISFNGDLRHPHLSQSFSTTDNVSPTRTWNYDIRGKVAMLTRSIKIEGESPGSNGFGGHVMIMGKINGNSRAGIAKIEDVRFRKMGQRSLVGRYPFHWHMLASDGSNQYIEECSIDESFNRAITIHGTHNTTVSGNFAYKHLGHGIFLEDGGEENNKITKNLVMLSAKPKNGEEILQTDNGFRTVQNETPSAFWITNPKNTIEDNIVSGTEGVAYWFALNDKPSGLSGSDSRLRNLKPRTSPITSFKNNVAHSSRLGFDINDATRSDGGLRRNITYKPTSTQFIDGLKVFGCELGLYTGLAHSEGDLIFDNNQLIDNVDATMFAGYNTVQDSLFVNDIGGGLVKGTRYGARLYDGPGRFYNCHFQNFNKNNASLLRQGGGAVNRSNWLFEKSSFAPSGRPRIDMPGSTVGHNMDTVVDVDGSIAGINQASIVTAHNILRTPEDPAKPSNWRNAYLSRHEFASLIMTFSNTPNANVPALDIVRVNDRTNNRVTFRADHPQTPNRFICPIINSDYRYVVNFPQGRPSGKRINFIFRDCQNGDSVEFKISGIGNLNGRGLNIDRASSIANMRSRSTSSYVRTGNDVHFKYVRAASRIEVQQPVQIKWD